MNKKIMTLWLIVIIMLLSTILLIGLKQKDLKYIKLEYNIKYSAYKYINTNNIKINDKYEINIEKLIDENKITEDLIEKYCIKSVDIEKKLFTKKYQIIVKCNEK